MMSFRVGIRGSANWFWWWLHCISVSAGFSTDTINIGLLQRHCVCRRKKNRKNKKASVWRGNFLFPLLSGSWFCVTQFCGHFSGAPAGDFASFSLGRR